MPDAHSGSRERQRRDVGDSLTTPGLHHEASLCLLRLSPAVHSRHPRATKLRTLRRNVAHPVHQIAPPRQRLPRRQSDDGRRRHTGRDAMTRDEEIAEIRKVQARWKLFREFVATQTTGPAKQRILDTTDALIAKADRYIRELEQPDANTPVVLLAPAALQ
jgi:hypothetical protein